MNTDFTNSEGAIINPQTIKYKDLTNTKLSHSKLEGSLEDVIIIGTDFTNSKNASINPQTIADKNLKGTNLAFAKVIENFKDCIYDCDTLYKGKPLYTINNEFIKDVLNNLKKIKVIDDNKTKVLAP